MTCHNEWEGAPRALCYNLRSVPAGADVYTRSADGEAHHWRVDRVDSVAYDAVVPGLFSSSGPPRLSIITCAGSWDAVR